MQLLFDFFLFSVLAELRTAFYFKYHSLEVYGIPSADNNWQSFVREKWHQNFFTKKYMFGSNPVCPGPGIYCLKIHTPKMHRCNETDVIHSKTCRFYK